MTLSPAHLRDQGIPYWKQIIVSGLYTGLAPIASGTVASALAALFYFIPSFSLFPGFSNFWVLLVASLVAFAVGIPLAHDVEKVTGPDPSFITLDEFAGMWLTLASPLVIPNPYWVVLCFLIFRIFDIAKVWPSSYFERRPGGLGVMADDMAAAVYANVVSHLIWLGLSFIGPVIGFMQ